MKKITLSITLLLAIFFFTACTNQDIELNESPLVSITTIEGIATAIVFGKDGYTATIQTKSNDTYQALVSISNMGRENYATMEINDKASFEGTVQTIGTEEHIKVSKIIDIEKATPMLLISETSFEGISPGDCLLYTSPSPRD